MGTASDELLFFGIHGKEWAGEGFGGARLDFGEEQHITFARNDIDFAATGCTEVAVEHFAALGAQPLAGDAFPEFANGFGGERGAVTIRQMAASVEQRAETIDDEGDRVHGRGVLQDVPWYHILCGVQSRIGGIARRRRS